MIKRISRYYGKQDFRLEAPSYLREWFRVEVLIDESLNIFVINQYHRVGKEWKLIKTEAYMNKTVLLDKVKTLDTYYKALRADLLDRTVDTYKTHKVEEREQRTEVFYLVRDFAHFLLMKKRYLSDFYGSKDKEAFCKENKNRAIYVIKLGQHIVEKELELKEKKRIPKSFNINKEAENYIKTTGLTIYTSQTYGTSFYKNSKEYQERISNKFKYPHINDPYTHWCENEYRD